MITKQIRSTDGTGTLSYLVFDGHVGILIDPNIEDVKLISSMLQDLDIRITHIIDTHTHADHVSAAGEFRKMFGSLVVMHENTKNKWKVVDQGDKFGIGDTLRANAAIPIDRYVAEGDTIDAGPLSAYVMFTPGHTDNHIALLIGDSLFTGDLLLIGQAGRSDLPGGDPGEQYESLFGKVVLLPDATKIYPGHDYDNKVFAYLKDEKKSNPFLQPRSKPEYVDFVREFFPPIAEMVAAGGKMTLQCGTQRVVQATDTVESISSRELAAMVSSGISPILLDVREAFELATVGAIEGVQNIPVGQLKGKLDLLPADKSAALVCICQSGGRSFEAAHFLRTQGYTNVMNLDGGTSGWMKNGYKVVRPVGKS